MKIEIKARFSGSVLFSHEVEGNTMKLTLEAAIKAKADLSGADLSGAYLRSADLRSAYLRSADLSGADLSSADLSGADLRSADLRSADLSSADLSGADLSGADLSGADLRSADLSGADLPGADLSGADLSGADLRSADLSGADLQPIHADFVAVISQAPREVPALIKALKEGRVDGSTYSGECACLVGTIANAQGVSVDSSAFKVERNAGRPAERFFLGIAEGDTPETNQASALALQWAEDWYARMSAAFGSAT